MKTKQNSWVSRERSCAAVWTSASAEVLDEMSST